ncbi:MAG TPA: hypothetical protein VMU97_02940 [Candidatus Dormibacteraeota bacterium]|nr:hypothetical protein [Candidatus Dormibacteraeota bacterium]
MRHKALIFFAGGQVCFFGGLAVCVALRPEGLGANDGISYYGIVINTLPFYLISLLGTAVFSLLAAKLINLPDLRPLRYGLLIFALLTIVVALTPYILLTFLDWLHTIAGIVTFMVQVALSFWLLAKLRWTGWALLLVILEVVTGAISLAYVLPSHGFLIQSQVSFQLAFGALVLYGFRELLPE